MFPSVERVEVPVERVDVPVERVEVPVERVDVPVERVEVFVFPDEDVLAGVRVVVACPDDFTRLVVVVRDSACFCERVDELPDVWRVVAGCCVVVVVVVVLVA